MQSQSGSVSDWKLGSLSVVRYGTGSAATWPSQASRTRLTSGSIVCGPRMQFRPTTAAPASSSRRHASSGVQPSRVSGARWTASVITAGSPVSAITSSAICASAPQENVSPMMKSTPASTAQPTCSENMPRTAATASASSGSKMFVLQMSPASSAPVSLATSPAICSACRLISSSASSLPISRSFSRCA